ncbi:MAG: hypothetical protein P8X42_06735 [Calditrichaceae bacterium]
MRNYAQLLAYNRYKQKFRVNQICDLIMTSGEIICEKLNLEPGLRKFRQEVHDYVNLNLQLAVDEIEEMYEQLDSQEIRAEMDKKFSDLLMDEKKMAQIVRQLEDTCKGDWDIMSMIT